MDRLGGGVRAACATRTPRSSRSAGTTGSTPPGAALEIADGGLLPGLEADWIDAKRAELADLRVELLELVAVCGTRLGGGELLRAEQAARAAVEAAPFRESARAALIEVLRVRGNVADALRAFEDARTLLRDELGALPGPLLLGLHEQLLHAEPAPPRRDPRSPAGWRRVRPGPACPDATPLVLLTHSSSFVQVTPSDCANIVAWSLGNVGHGGSEWACGYAGRS